MKKLITISTLLFCVYSFSYSQAEDFEKPVIIRNHVKTKTQSDFKYIDGKPARTGVKVSRTYYNPSGEILKKEILNNTGQVTAWEKYEYDANNNRILFEREGSGSTYKKTSAYDTKNNLIKETGFNGAENFKNDFKYNTANKLTEALYSLNNKIQQKLVYNNSGNTTNAEVYMNGATLSSKIKIVYDSKGNIIEETTYNISGQELEKKKFVYNASSKIIEETKTRKGSFFYRLTYEYNSRGDQTAMYEETLSKTKFLKKQYIYDAAGHLVEFKWRRTPDEEFNVKKYTVDTKGLYLTEYTYYPKTKYELLSKFEYEYY